MSSMIYSDKGFYMQKKQFTYFTDMLNYIEAINLASGYDKQPTNQAILVAQSLYTIDRSE